MSRLAQSVEVRWCDWCGTTLKRHRWPSGRVESPKAYGQRKFCGRRCNVESGAAADGGKSRAESARRDEKGRFGLEYEPKPAWTECTACGARRPPDALKDGRCRLWEFATFAEANGEITALRENRCAELAATRGGGK